MGKKVEWMYEAVNTLALKPEGYAYMTAALLVLDGMLTSLILGRVAYTEIDFTTYVRQAQLFMNGERDYSRINPWNGSGPCVYPAGHLYVYAVLDWLTVGARNLFPAQVCFGVLYLSTFCIIAKLYYMSGAPPMLLIPLVLSKRLHSIYVLRMFNDPIAMFLVYNSIYWLCRRKWRLACVLYSLGLSIKMHVLLFLPGLGVVLFRGSGAMHTLQCLIWIVGVQVLIGSPFLMHDAQAYFSSAFDFSREFLFKWTVNWRFVGEKVFGAKSFARSLLYMHGLLLLLFGMYRWTSLAKEGPRWIWNRWNGEQRSNLTSFTIVWIMFSSNLLGMVCARSLHYQFYSWYAHTLPMLVWSTGLWPSVK
ncbi:dolichyl-P-Man:Man5GlcNAc2-PP-dolichol alpha-1,3-mannosyltransferase [Malassezia yamatoensis]|uniref:Dol-P-Man:Man(5)GlcNAc(2)-PP-Dol alpha-1,3-mannosyltransferase n=1 Tax=Malassezia yamatoensis TaxID=253288 RepID=A0AAJ6CK72_9BASI|nr:dolichyl-P-Man:Man5GlcNAc2-PP-dolichol alpha-1,3-mannosyltransferase [Malassezia yamatoensis]